MSTLGDPHFLFSVPVEPTTQQAGSISSVPDGPDPAHKGSASTNDARSVSCEDSHNLILRRSRIGSRFMSTSASYQSALELEACTSEVPRRITIMWSCAGRALGQLKRLDSKSDAAPDTQSTATDRTKIHAELSGVLVHALATLISGSNLEKPLIPFGVSASSSYGLVGWCRTFLGKLFPKLDPLSHGSAHDLAAAHEGTLLVLNGLAEKPTDLRVVLTSVNSWLTSIIQSVAESNAPREEDEVLASLIGRAHASEDDLSALWAEPPQDKSSIWPTKPLVPPLFADALTDAMIPIYAQSPKLLEPIHDLYRSLGILDPWFQRLESEGLRIFNRAQGKKFEPPILDGLNVNGPVNTEINKPNGESPPPTQS